LPTWRQRLGPAGTHVLEAAILQLLVRATMVEGRWMAPDTTAQEKPIASPMDTALLEKGRRHLLPLRGDAQAAGLAVAQGLRRFNRRATQVVLAAAKCGKDRLERIQVANRQLSGMAPHVRQRVPRVMTQLNGKLGALRRQGRVNTAAAVQRRRDQLRQTARVGQRLIHQHAERFQGRHVSANVLRRHAPQVVSIGQGKRTKPAEYGCKVSVSMDRHGLVITQTEYAGHIADADTLPAAMGGWRQVFGPPPPALAGDRGFHPPEADRARVGTAAVVHLSIPYTGKTRHPDADTAWFKRLPRCRSPIEPVLSPLNADHRMDRGRYRGFAGDQRHVSWAVLAWNTQKGGRLLHQRLLTAPSLQRPAAYTRDTPDGGASRSPVMTGQRDQEARQPEHLIFQYELVRREAQQEAHKLRALSMMILEPPSLQRLTARPGAGPRSRLDLSRLTCLWRTHGFWLPYNPSLTSPAWRAPTVSSSTYTSAAWVP
jgi:hypothetical protein